MTDISVIIPVGCEERHIARCLRMLAPLEPRQIFVIESRRGDRTHEITAQTAAALGWEIAGPSARKDISSETAAGDVLPPVDLSRAFAGASLSVTRRAASLAPQTTLHFIAHEWPGSLVRQLNWARNTLDLAGTWVLHLAADEYLTSETIARMSEAFELDAPQTFGLVFKPYGALSARVRSEEAEAYSLACRRRFLGHELRHGVSPMRLPRLFRRASGDLVSAKEGGFAPQDAEVTEFPGAFVADSLLTLPEWRSASAAIARPAFPRRLARFVRDYLLRGGFLDGLPALHYHLLSA